MQAVFVDAFAIELQASTARSRSRLGFGYCRAQIRAASVSERSMWAIRLRRHEIRHRVNSPLAAQSGAAKPGI